MGLRVESLLGMPFGCMMGLLGLSTWEKVLDGAKLRHTECTISTGGGTGEGGRRRGTLGGSVSYSNVDG